MDIIRKPVLAARRRLFLQSFLDWTSRVALIVLCIATIGIVSAKFIQVPVPYETWMQGWLIGAGATVFLLVPILVWWTRPSYNSIATSVDQRLNLRERISSAGQMSEAEKATPMGAALWADAVKRAQNLDVRDAFPVRIHSHFVRLVAPAVVIGFSLLLPDPEATAVVNPQQLTVEQVKNSLAPLIQQVRKQRIEAEESKDDEAELLKDLENKLQDMQKKPPKDASKLMSDLKKMQDQLEDKRRQMGTGESLKKQFANVKKMENGPAEEFADAMRDGDMETAAEQLNQLMQKLEKDQLTKEEQKELAKQLEQFEKALEQSIEEHKQAKQQLEEQIKQAEAAGDSQKAQELSEKLDALKQSDADMQAASEMKQSLADAKECLNSGECKNASQKLSKMKEGLSKMASDAKKAESLKELSQSMNSSKKSSTCSSCNGQGCKECMGNGQGQGQGNQSFYSKGGKGKGKGHGRSTYSEGEHNDPNKSYETQVRGDMREGELVMGGSVGGENKKTPSNVEFREAVLSAEVEESDPIEQARLPKRERDISKEYMDKVRDGE